MLSQICIFIVSYHQSYSQMKEKNIQSFEIHSYLLLSYWQFINYLDGAFSLRINKLSVPKRVSIELECDYDLEGGRLYAVKWYKGGREFYRYIPSENPATKIFAVSGINVNVSESKNCTCEFNLSNCSHIELTEFELL